MDTSALEGLRTQLIALHDRFSQAAHVYQQAADVFRQGLLPSIPPELEIRELGSVREKTLAVLSEAGYRVGLEPLPYDGSLTLADAYLDRIIQAIQAQEKKHRLIADVRRVIQEVQPLRHRREQAKLSSVVQAIAQLEGKLTEEVDFAEAEVMKAAGPIEMLGKYARHRPGLSDDDYDACRRQIEEHFGRWLLRDIDRGWIDTGSQNGQDTHETSDETTAHDDRPEAPDIGMPPTGETNEESDHGTLDETDATASRIGTSDPPASAVKDSLHDNETTIEDESQSIADEKTERIEEETNDLVDEHQQETATNAAENSSHPSESIISQVPTESLKEHSDLPPEGGTPQTTYNNEAAPSHPDSPHSFGRNLGTLPWRLLASDFPGLAYYASMAFETEGVDAEYPPAWLIRAATFGPFVDLSDDFKNMVQEDLSHFDAGDERHRATEFNLLLATATIAPALFAPNLTNAPSYLSHVEAPGGMEALNNCLHELKKYSSFRLPLDPSRLATDIYRIRDCDPLVVRASEWKRHALELTIKYQGATRIWKSWLRSDGPITRLIDAIIQNRQTEAEDISALVYTFGAPKEVAREIDALVKPTQEIIGQARQQLIAKAREAAELGEEWLAWLGSQSTSTAREDERLDELRASLTEYLPLAIEELKELVQAQPNSVAAIAGTLLADALGVMNARLFGSIDIPTDSVIAHFFGPITRLDIALDSDGRPRCSQPGQLLNVKEIIRKLLDAARLGLPSWEDAFQNFVKKEDHNSSQHLIDFARLSGKIEMAARFESEREQALSMSRRQLLERAKDTHLKLERSFAYGVIPAEERDRLRSLVSDIQRSSPALLRFDQHHSDLNAAEETIRAYNNRAIDAVRLRLNELESTLDETTRRRMEDILTLGDLHTANDYIERLSQGEALPDSNYQTAFDSFFPEQVDLIYDCLDRERPIWAHFIERIRKGKTPDGQTARIAHLEFGAQAEAQRDTLADSIEAWFDLKQRRVDSDPDAIRILTELGFSIRQLETVCDQQRTYITFEADVPHPSRVLIPAFGSDFQGRYRVLCVWDSPDEEELLDHLANIDYGHALLVFYFGTLSVLARRRLAHLCRQRRHQKGSKAIVIDDILFLYVMSHPRGIRMRTLFECGLPFTVSEPYNAQSSHVATEMFYGRERELERIFNPKDTSLIYGGRQLGKTALLHYAASQFNQHPKRHACYIDLNANLVGITQKPSYVWRLITESLIDEGVLEDTVPVSVRPDKLNDLISTWLSEDTERRILILLDEADRFFEFDSQQHYAQTQQLKGLMESTERRFKVVFAGLHNVYRSSRDPNQPLHHLQEPICIGPLLVETEKKAAAALVEQPLKALGYRFESPDLVSLILSQTNYYPSLIQLYCQQLLKDLGESTHVRFDPRLTPPYLITSQQIRHSYEQHDLFMRIRKKFELTIELDERYAIIANSIALAILEGDKNGDDVTGFAVDWIKDACIGWWELGFRGSADEEDVRTLVEEMVGLGVLRRIAVKGENRVQRYTLRSPNVLTLLGTREEIEQALLKERRPRPTNDPITFRSPCDDGLLAPLTAQQSNNLVMPENGITLIFGTIASSIHRVADYLQSRAMDADVRVFTAGTETTAFVNWLEENTSSHRKAGVTLLVVPESIPWSSHWIEMAEGRIASLSSSRAFVRVVFLGDADTAMRFTREHEKRLPQIETLQVQIITLTPWHANALYLWLDQMEPSVDEAMAKHISHATANWPFLLDHLRGIVQTGTMSWPPVLAQFTRLLQDNKSEFLRAFGLTDEYQRNILAAIAAWDGLDGIFKDDLLDLLHEEYQEPLIRDVLRWAGSLSLTVRKEGRICLTPPLQELLRP